MKFVNEKDTLSISFEGEINSFNADEIEKEVERITSQQTFKKLVLDFLNLKYISSAGLRIILKLKQKYDDVHIVEASLEVYDVLTMTGFTNIMDVKKALTRVSVDGAKIIGTGFFSTVYRVTPDTIIKVFNRVSDPQQIERELSLAKQAFVLGIPTAISYDIVRVNDKYGVRFEMLDCISLKDAFLEQTDKYDELIDRYVALLKKINTTTCLDPNVRSLKEFYLEKVDVCKQFIDEKHYQKARKMIEEIPDDMTFVHGDCHFKNIMVQNGDFLLIDMDTLSHGNPLFEFAAIRAPYLAFEEDDPGNTARFLGVPKEMCAKIYYDTLERYFGKADKAIIDKIAIACYIHMVWWNTVNTPENKARLNGCKERLIKLLDEYDDLLIG